MEQKVYRLIIVICGILNFELVQAQGITFKHLTEADGLSHYTVHSIYQDERGFMWFGTENGANLYNGKSIKVYRHNSNDSNSLQNNCVKQIVGNRKGTIFFRTRTGVQSYDIKKDKFTILYPKQTSYIFFDEGLYLADKNQILKFNGKEFELFYQLPYEKVRISTICIHNDSIAIGTNSHGLFLLHQKNLSHPIPTGYITDVFRDCSGNYWVTNSTDNVGLCQINREGKIEIFKCIADNTNSLTSNYTHKVCQDKKGNIWIGTFNGLTEYDPKTKKFVRHTKMEHSKGLSHSSIWGLYCDDQGTIWLGTYFGGVNYFNPDKQMYQEFRASTKEEDGLNCSIVSQMVEDSERNLWIGTEGGGINKYNRTINRFEWYSYSGQMNGISHNNVKTIHYDSLHQALWIGTHLGGLNKFDLRTNRFTVYRHKADDSTSLPSNTILNIVPYDKDRLLLSTSNGISVFNMQTGKCRYLFQDLSSIRPNKSAIGWLRDHEGIIWITVSRNGVRSYNPDTKELKTYKRKLHSKSGLSSNDINSIYEDSQHRLWFCTNESGLDFYDRTTRQFRNYNDTTSGNKERRGRMFNICEIDSIHLLVTTEKGFSIFDCQSGNFLNYTNLPLASLKENALYRTKDGTFFIGGTSGLISFTQESIENSSHKYAIYPSRLFVNGREVNVNDESHILSQDLPSTRQITLQPGQNVLNIEYGVTDYIPYSEDDILYRLEGFSDTWTPLNAQNLITYTNLTPGTYTLVVKAQNQKNETVAESRLQIAVLPPLYLTTWAFMFYLLVTAGVIYYGVRSYKRRIKLQESLKYEQKHAEDIEKMNQAKLRFFTNISHEFRTPLTLIISQVEILLQIHSLAPSVYNKILGVYKNCLQLKELINELLDFRKQEQGYMTIKVSEHNIVEFLYKHFLFFQEYARKQQITFNFLKSNEEIPLWFDAKQMQKVINNLLSNAFKHTKEGGNISISVKKRSQEVLIEVMDSGTGIAPQEVKKIFNRFYQTELSDSTLTQSGSGIGLALTKGIVDLHHGTIEVFSELGEGTTFCVHLKCGNEHFSPDQIVENKGIEEMISPAGDAVTNLQIPFAESGNVDKMEDEGEANKRKILIVEDNESLRQMLVDVFKGFYNVLTACNGTEGLEKVKSEQPDLVLSDVIMPQMSGTELCRILKNNMETCHIPVVLLTARTAVEHTLEGLKTGADDYITKPFNVNILLARCNNLVNSRIMLQEKFSKQPQTTPYILATNEMDKKFVAQVTEVIEKHVEDPDFKVDILAEELGIARNKLFVKIKAITGQTPNAFIMTYRLKKAAVMLKSNPELNISEIADCLGFSLPKYFTKCFKEKYNMTPYEYRKCK